MTENTLSFRDLNLIEPLNRALEKLNYNTPTPIQSKSIPSLLKGLDLIGIAQTGTGKTAAFALPILQRMKPIHPRQIKTLVLAPTRELAAQIGESFAKYSAFLSYKLTVIFGGVGQGSQVQALQHGIDILVATPGRLLDLLNQRKLDLNRVEFFVLDEADRMLDMGFIHDIKKIIGRLPYHRQSLFFSATMSPDVTKLAETMLNNPVQVAVTPHATTVDKIKQCVFFVDPHSKEKLLLNLLNQDELKSVLIFTRTKHKANKIAKFLINHNISAGAIHGNKSQGARTKAISDFKSGNIKVLVATDIAARGIDINNITHVINFELPNESESYVHRIGRTGRAGNEGTAFSFCSAEERNFLRDIETLTKKQLQIMTHKFHSETAKNATGASARPKSRKQFGKKSSFKHRAKHDSNFKSKNKPHKPHKGKNRHKTDSTDYGSKMKKHKTISVKFNRKMKRRSKR